MVQSRSISALLRRLKRIVQDPAHVPWYVRTRVLEWYKTSGWKGLAGGAAAERSVVMFHLGRSGSTVLADLLNQHPDISWAGEIAKPLVTAAGRGEQVKPDALWELLDGGRARARGHSVFGVEIKPFHLERVGLTPGAFVDGARERGFSHFILLERENLLRKIVSSVLASRSGVWHAPKGASVAPRAVKLDPAGLMVDRVTRPLIAHLEGYRSALAEVRAAIGHGPVLELFYESDLQSDPAQAAGRTFRFLELPDRRVEVRYGRTAAAALPELIENFEEVVTALSGTEYAWMLELESVPGSLSEAMGRRVTAPPR